jgi:D-alanyl-D-alanine carboxypeptidase
LRSSRHLARLLPALAVLLLLLPVTAPAAAAPDKFAAIIVDGSTGKTLYARNADARRFPASLTKMMTLYVLFEELDAKRLTLSTPLTVSKNAAAQAPSKIGLRAGATIRVEDAIQALTTKSANDMAVVVAEGVAGSVPNFAARMNRAARALGMNSTIFRNPHGLPDPGQFTTARDFVRLAQALQDRFPGYYKYFGVRVFTYRGNRYRNHNRLLGSVEGVDGIKTGYTRASGFNLVTNVRRDGRHVIAVVMGGKTAGSRDAEMRRLIAKYLPAASRNGRSTPLVVAESTADSPIAAADAPDARTPRARPDRDEEPALAYAGAEAPHDLVAEALEQADTEDAGIAAGDIDDIAADDPIASRIATASEVAELALAEPPSGAAADPITRLTEMAEIRAGHRDMVAAAQPQERVTRQSGAAERAEAGWHIQIGAFPTAEGARALIEKAQGSMGSTLASAHPLTQEVSANGTTLYRARFAGFSDKEAARAACAKLKSKSFACLAVPN